MNRGDRREEISRDDQDRVREETTVTVKWIAERMGMGTTGYLNNRLYRWRKGTLK